MDRPLDCNGRNAPAAGRMQLRIVVRNGTVFDRAAAPAKAAPLALAPKVSLSDAVAAGIAGCLDHFEVNGRALLTTGDPEAVHQLRVALRRLRALLGLLKRRIHCPEFVAAATRAKSVANLLGAARDWDVFHAALEGRPRKILQDEPSFGALLAAVETRRLRALEAARSEIGASGAQAFLLDLRKFVAQRRWVEGAEGIEEKGSARAFAVKALDRLHRRALKRCEGIEKLCPERRHQARIALKKARYGAEFFESLFNEKAARAYLRALADIQDALGEDNDRATAARLLEEIASSDAGRAAAPAARMLADWNAKAQSRSAAASGKYEKRLRRLEPFWR
jgi:CHAD domain-containing protein